MELTQTYITSQVFAVIMYILIAFTYYFKDRKKILVFNFLSILANSVEFILLGAYSGLAMNGVAILRDIIFIADENNKPNNTKTTVKDIGILLLLVAISIILSIFTFDGIFSLFAMGATMIFTYSVWQKSTKVYKLLGPFVSLCWIVYKVHIKSIFGIILESVLLICTIIGYILEVKKEKNK